MTTLIVGALGQVGTELQQRAGRAAIALDRDDLDITQSDAVRSALHRLRPRIVINAAAYTAVDKAEQEFELAYAVNRDGPAYLSRACRALGIPLLHLSTDYVFDGGKSSPYLESDVPNPAGIYARSKWEGEQHVRAQLPEHIILRVSWVFGAHGNNFVKTILRLARERPELRVVADQRGCPTAAASIASALLTLSRRITQGEALPWGTYHFTGTPETTWHGFASNIVEQAQALGMLSQTPKIHAITTAEYPLPAPRPMNSLLDCSGAEKSLGLIRQDWRSGLHDVLIALKQQSA